ncbi:MAG: type II toxin-antitoxin system PemK/MazF family toxin [Nanoarchaeota archaeon]
MLEKDSTILLNQIRTIDKSRVLRRLSHIECNLMEKVNLAIRVSLGME